jgi:hypothetical protein
MSEVLHSFRATLQSRPGYHFCGQAFPGLKYSARVPYSYLSGFGGCRGVHPVVTAVLGLEFPVSSPETASSKP